MGTRSWIKTRERVSEWRSPAQRISGRGSPWFHAGKERAGRGNRTLLASLEGWSFTTKLYPRGANIGRGSRIRQGRNGHRKGQRIETNGAAVPFVSIRVIRWPWQPSGLRLEG